ncbi:MAG: HU family DNA-binding protein [Prevotella sp.]|nr:HU family DNA-binding protein [Prevotella sp.]
MSIKYRLQKNYGKLKEKAEFRAIIMERQTIGLERIGQNIQGAMSLTRADVFATVMALGDEIAYQLLDGNAVHLPGIGYFSLAVKGEVYEDPRTHNHRLRNPKVRTIKFRPDREMAHKLLSAKFENETHHYGNASIPTTEDIEQALKELFATKSVITIADFRRYLDLSASTAYRIVERLDTAGRIHNIGTRRLKLFELGSGRVDK